MYYLNDMQWICLIFWMVLFFFKVYCFNKKQKIKRTDRERIKKEMYIHMSDKRGNERKKQRETGTE